MASPQSDSRHDQHQVIDLTRRARPVGPQTLQREPTYAATRTSGHGGPEKREAARQAYRESIAAGQPLSGRELADRYGYSRSWGRDRINEVRAKATLAARAALTLGQDLTASHAGDDQNVDTAKDRPMNSAEPCDETPVLPSHEQRRQGQAGRGRRVAWLAFVVGIAASVAANVMHARIVSPSRAAWIGAAFWPVALLLAIEVWARVLWPRTAPWHRLARLAGTSLVAVVAAVLSYRHMAGLLAAWGEDTLSAYLGPLAVDGLMTMAAAALLIDGSTSHGRSATASGEQPPRPSAAQHGAPDDPSKPRVPASVTTAMLADSMPDAPTVPDQSYQESP